MTVEKVELVRRGGGDFIHIKPQFSTCEESVYVARNNSILQYSVKTGLLLFKYPDQETSIVGFDIANFNSSESLITSCQNGEITVWKTITRFKVTTKKISCSNLKSFHYLPSKHEDATSEAVITYIHPTRKTTVALVNISKESFRNYKLKLKGEQVFIGISRRRFFAVADKKRIHFITVGNTEKSNSVLLRDKSDYKKHFTCLECHSEEEIVITGDSEGKVTLWYDIFSVNPARSIYHWHTLPLNCLTFSATGSYFYSGGNENVLVRWDWENTQNKKFLPRMSGYIKNICVSSQSQLLAVSTSDNAVRILDTSFNDVSLIQQLVVGDNFECGITLDPRTKALVMNGSLGQIQFYQPNTSALLYSMEVVGQNKLTDERNFSVDNTRVTKFAISRSGLWLTTVEERKDSNRVHEMRLKFWNFDASRQTFELNTSIEKPHQESITSVAFQTCCNDDNLRCASVGKDKKFRVWHKTVIQQANIDRIIWNCLSVGFYRNLPCKGLSFSADGSLMGIGFGCMITTWTPNSCDLKCSLVYPGHKADIEEIQFGTSNQCHLVVAASNERLSVWNLLTLTMIWTVPVEVDFLLADKLSVYMAVITKNSELFVFSPNSPNPVYSSDEILRSRQVMAAAFIPTRFCQDVQSEWYKRVELFLVDSNKELFSIGVESMDAYVRESYSDDIADESTLSLYSRMMPFKKVSSASIEHRKHLFEKDSSRKSIKQYLEAPVHTMMPIQLTCSALIKSLIVQKNLNDVAV